MTQVPFTPDGVIQKTEELYSLTDDALLVQVSDIANDISSWLDANFTLSTQQKAYASSAPALVQRNWGAVVAAAVSGRRPIIMAPPPQYGPPRRTKQIRINIDGMLEYTPPMSGAGSVEGDFVLNINWEVVD